MDCVPSEAMSTVGDNDTPDAATAEGEEDSGAPSNYTKEQLEPMAILRSLADSQKILTQMLERNPNIRQNGENFNGPKARILAVVKIPPFDGATTTTARQYKEWRKSVALTKQLNGLEDRDIALLLFGQLTGRAKELIEILELEDFEDGKVLDMIWQIFDSAFEKMEHQRLHDVHRVWEGAHRKHGQPMQDWCNYLRKHAWTFIPKTSRLS